MARPRTGSAVYRHGRWYARITLGREPKGAEGRHPRIEHVVTRDGQPVTSESRADEGYARRYANRMQERYDDGSWSPEGRSPEVVVTKEMTVATWCDTWLAARTYPEAERDRRRTAAALALVDKKTDWCFGSLPISRVVPKDMAGWLLLVRARTTKRGGKPLAPRTVRNTFDPVMRALRGAVFEGLLAQDPTSVLPTEVRPQAVDADPTRRRGYRLARAEVETLLGEPSIESRWLVMWWVLVLTGMRVSEAIALQWDDLLEEQPLRRIMVVKQLHHRTRKVVALKTKTSRDVPEHPLLRTILDWWQTEGWREEYGRTPKSFELLVPCRGQSGRPWGTANGPGGPLWQQDVYRALQRDLVACGIRPHRVHDFRHTLASLCADAGMAEPVASRWTHAPTGDTARHLYALPSWDRQCLEMLKLELRPRRSRFTAGTKAPGPTGAHPD